MITKTQLQELIRLLDRGYDALAKSSKTKEKNLANRMSSFSRKLKRKL